MRNETMFRILLSMAQAGKYSSVVEERTIKLAGKYKFSQADLDALKATQELATGGASTGE